MGEKVELMVEKEEGRKEEVGIYTRERDDRTALPEGERVMTWKYIV